MDVLNCLNKVDVIPSVVSLPFRLTLALNVEYHFALLFGPGRTESVLMRYNIWDGSSHLQFW